MRRWIAYTDICMSYRDKTFSEYSSSTNENKYKFNAVELKRPRRRMPIVAVSSPFALHYTHFIKPTCNSSLLFHSNLPHIAHSLLSISIITMKLFRIVYITFLTASSAAASPTRVMTALPPQISCIGPCISSKESLNCPSGTSPAWMVTCWRCCGPSG
ncbi:uncharacterized protein F5147DRAFT_418644 [Suillus discolor]|uniref:Uncharacterized protein n=1 Tax=Suillus discolor TaxID=1912936 RepID=A0A9P7EVT6_9AGAM|nr:uncharacterized protein F5147DRAFT_418644 [Suillus discolor]KAG2094033.1 hypothetical protein F5147DRAFT_418644 [Suillus discolor]